MIRAQAIIRQKKTVAVPLAILGVCSAEIISILLSSTLTVLLHALLLAFFLAAAVYQRNKPAGRLFPIFALIPLLRVLSLTMPIQSLPPIYWYALIGLPLLLAAWLTMQFLELTWGQIGLGKITQTRWLPQFLIILTGPPLGLLAYVATPPAPPSDLSTMQLVTGTMILIFFVGFVEEFILRGLLQKTLTDLYNIDSAAIYTNTLFIALHAGTLSLSFILFVGMFGLFLSWCVKYTGSLWGVILARGTFTATLLLIAPTVWG